MDVEGSGNGPSVLALVLIIGRLPALMLIEAKLTAGDAAVATILRAGNV
jgi:hypothetical protein